MKVVSSVLPIVTSHPRKSVTSPRLYISACWCALAGLALLPAAFRAWSAECVPPPAGLVSWWSGEGNADDSVGLAGGTLYGGVTFAPGRVGRCFAFDGAGGVVNVPDLPALALTNSLTIECWLFVTNAPSTVGMVILRGDTRPGLDPYTVYVAPGAGGSAEVGFTVTDASNHGVAIASVMPTGDWTHVAATLDDATGLMRLYTNGVVADQTTTTIRPLAPLDPYSQAGVGIGNVSHQPSVFNYPFRGRIDELSVYSRALSATEVQAVYNAGSAGKCVLQPSNCIPPPSGLVGWWPGEGNPNDIVGTNNGTLLNGATFAPGEVGSAFGFNGNQQCIQVPYSQALVGPNYSVEAWIEPLAQVSDVLDQAVIFGQSYGQSLLLARKGSTGVRIAFQFVVSTVTPYEVVSTNEIPIGQFSHLVGTWDGMTLRLYVNGVLNAQSMPGASPVDSGCPFSIGGFYNTCGYVGQFFNGLIDEVSYYNRALSGGEIQAIYLADGAGKCKLCCPHAATASAVVVSNFVVGSNITDGGCGYTNTPTVRIIGGGGSGAKAVAVVSNGVVIAVNLLAAGSGYTNAPVIVIDPPFFSQPTMGIKSMSLLSFTKLALGTNYQFQVLVGNTWSNLGAAFTATDPTFTQYVSGTADPSHYHLATTPLPLQARATAQRVNGFVVGATVTSGGSGYVTNPAVTIAGGGGTNATAISHVSAGRVTSITITDAGIGYTSTPTIQIAPPPPGFALSPTALPVMRLDSASLAPYENYQIQFKPNLGGVWENWNGGLFSPTDVTNSQYLFITNAVGFFRLQNVP
jgi:hypothetical protein